MKLDQFNKPLSLLLVIAMVINSGCMSREAAPRFSDSDFQHYQRIATDVEYPDTECNPGAEPTAQPLTIADQPRAHWDMPLEEAIQLSLQNSRVMRDLGGFVLRSPASTKTVHGPAIQEVDPRFGVEAALSEFDTTFAAKTSWEKNDRAFNNLLLGGGTNFFTQDLGVVQAQLQKKTANGSTFTARHNIDYDANSAPANLFGSAWNTNFEAEFRQPLLQNAGVEYNRIAGPNAQPGVYNGVLIARTQTDVAIADFEAGIRDLVSNVENAYWDLYFAYRDLDAKIAARDSGLESWRRVHALFEAGRKGGEAEKEAEAREQYYRFYEEVQNALTGRLIDGTQINNGSSGGSFRANSGVHVAERRLRLLIGLPITDGRLIRPSNEPILAKVSFDWNDALSDALARRTELRRQQWIIKRRELELCAAKNFLQPNLDATGRYRWRGFGKDLLDSSGEGLGPFDASYDNLFGGDFQEWQVGMELNMPLGFRKAHAAVRHAELNLARDRAILVEQERDVQLGLSNAFAEVERAYAVAQTNYNRRVAAKENLAGTRASYESDKISLDMLLDSQRRSADTDSRYHAALVDYALAIKNVHYEKGTLLEHDSIRLAEGPWPNQAYRDAARRDGSGRPKAPLNYIMRRGSSITDDGSSLPYGDVSNGDYAKKSEGNATQLASGTTTPTQNVPASATTPVAAPTTTTATNSPTTSTIPAANNTTLPSTPSSTAPKPNVSAPVSTSLYSTLVPPTAKPPVSSNAPLTSSPSSSASLLDTLSAPKTATTPSTVSATKTVPSSTLPVTTIPPSRLTLPAPSSVPTKPISPLSPATSPKSDAKAIEDKIYSAGTTTNSFSSGLNSPNTQILQTSAAYSSQPMQLPPSRIEPQQLAPGTIPHNQSPLQPVPLNGAPSNGTLPRFVPSSPVPMNQSSPNPLPNNAMNGHAGSSAMYYAPINSDKAPSTSAPLTSIPSHQVPRQSAPNQFAPSANSVPMYLPPATGLYGAAPQSTAAPNMLPSPAKIEFLPPVE